MSVCPCIHCHAIRVDLLNKMPHRNIRALASSQKDYDRRVKQAQGKVEEALASGQRDYDRRVKQAKKRASNLPVARLIPSGKPSVRHNQDVGGWWANLKARICLLLRL